MMIFFSRLRRLGGFLPPGFQNPRKPRLCFFPGLTEPGALFPDKVKIEIFLVPFRLSSFSFYLFSPLFLFSSSSFLLSPPHLSSPSSPTSLFLPLLLLFSLPPSCPPAPLPLNPLKNYHWLETNFEFKK